MRRTGPLIVGGGPAGAAAAITLARAGVRPILLERSRETADALCGGFLSWRSIETLERLGIDIDRWSDARIDRVRLYAGRHVATAALPRLGLAVSRRSLDAALLDQAARVCAVERGVAVRALEDDRLRLADGAAMTSDGIFLATGKHELRGATRPASARGQDPTLGLRVRLPASPHLDRLVGGAVELHLFDRGYAGIARQEDGSVNLCMAVHRSRLDTAGSPAALLSALGAAEPALGERLAFMDSRIVDAVANVPYGWRARIGRAGLFRLGDQAAVIPSLAGEGMGIALASGLAAANAYARRGPEASRTWQPGLARALFRPMTIAGLLRGVAEGPAAPWLVRAAPPYLIQLIAAATRIAHNVP